MEERLEAVVTGKVQGVSFRDFTCRKAQALGLCGEVKNLPDGTVHVVAEGIGPKLREFVRHLYRGPVRANVKQVHCIWKSPQGSHTKFDIA